MLIVLRGLISRICLANLDDVIVFSRRFNQHFDDLRAVFTRILGAGLKLKPSKCHLFRDDVLYLGHIVNASGVSPDPAKLRVLSTWPIPATVCNVLLFVGFVNIYGYYIAGSKRLTVPLYALTAGHRGIEKFVFDAEELVAFNSLKQAFVAGPQLAHFDFSKQCFVHTDAFKIAIGAVLLQQSVKGVERPISFFLKKLSAPQQNYSTFERKCLAIVAAAQQFHVYFFGRPFIFRTDHKALSWLFTNEPKGSARVSGWIATLMECRFKSSTSRAPRT